MVAHVVIGTLILGSYLALILDREFWPFSPYPMYSYTVNDKTVTGMRLYGVTQEEPHREIPLRNPDYVRPFSPFALEFAWGRLYLKGDRRALDEALRDSLRRYEKFRAAGRHDGPPLAGMRLYQEEWRLDPQAENLDQPDHRRLVAEVGRRPGD